MLRRPLHRLADSRPGTSYLYEFAWPSGRPGLGACHSLELGFVFDAGHSPDSVKLAGGNPPKTLATQMHGAWTRFVQTGDPGWEAWDATHPVRVFGDGETRTVPGLRDADLALWDAEPAVPHQAEAIVQPLPARSLRATELRSVVRRLRRTGSGKAG
jgi:para-nitrobenzyl esterase